MDRDLMVSEAEAQRGVRALGLPRTPNLQKRRWRGSAGPPSYATAAGFAYRWGDVLDWIEAEFQGYSKIDLRGTALGCWLLAHGHTAVSFAQLLDLSQYTVYRLLGHRNALVGNGTATVNMSVLELVSLETGIPAGTLVEDQIRNANGRNPNGKRQSQPQPSDRGRR